LDLSHTTIALLFLAMENNVYSISLIRNAAEPWHSVIKMQIFLSHFEVLILQHVCSGTYNILKESCKI